MLCAFAVFAATSCANAPDPGSPFGRDRVVDPELATWDLRGVFRADELAHPECRQRWLESRAPGVDREDFKSDYWTIARCGDYFRYRMVYADDYYTEEGGKIVRAHLARKIDLEARPEAPPQREPVPLPRTFATVSHRPERLALFHFAASDSLLVTSEALVVGAGGEHELAVRLADVRGLRWGTLERSGIEWAIVDWGDPVQTLALAGERTSEIFETVRSALERSWPATQRR